MTRWLVAGETHVQTPQAPSSRWGGLCSKPLFFFGTQSYFEVLLILSDVKLGRLRKIEITLLL